MAEGSGMTTPLVSQQKLLVQHREKHFTAGRWYLAAKSEADHYERELRREQEEIVSVPDTEAAEIGEILSQYGLEPHEYAPLVNALRRDPRPGEGGEERGNDSGGVRGGGLVPLAPYAFVPAAGRAMLTSAAVTLAALLFFGYVKGRFTGNRPFLSALQTAFIGAIASAAAYALAKALQLS
ncbi:unnamed protein product [Spirodela intermedia]|uniref:Vacuolar iron transporter n=1 Tax=Spirodela intermedia TaxID=51605 RepID=A0A7I8J3V3_SPIIN|nr:unnamed protein product [Spirodela intermedia]CAA6664770.1 unnamed protein product [Spirodela intermedia]